MAYIGNARTLMIFGSNVKDDLIPNGTNTFILSQEVPGGYEGNVWVLKKKWNGEEDTSFWEVLEPEIDYRIFGDGDIINRKIELISYIPSINDKVYVIHKGDATYNFVPSPKSVGPDQLSENLRNFTTDIFTGDGTTTTFVLSTDVASANSILVTINGIVKSANTSINQNDGDYSISTNGKQITFNIAPTNNSKIRILHLSFSTISRRASFAPGQEPKVILDNSVEENMIKNDAITKNKIAENSVDGDRILLDNDQSIRSKKLDGTSTNILKLSSDDNTTLITPNALDVVVNTNKILSISSTNILPENTDQISIGSDNKKIKDINISGNIYVGGTVDGVDVSVLKQLVDQIKTSIDDGTLGLSILPIGTILIYSSENIPNNFMKCDGSVISRTEYPSLFSLIGTTFGSGNGSTTFNLPDLRNRIAVGSNGNIGSNDGQVVASRSITHTHNIPQHTHPIPTHTHTVPGHYHEHSLSLGSDLNISSSGTHTTSIDIAHSHTGTTNINTTGIAILSKVSGLSLIDPGHNHGGATGNPSASLSHNHTNTLIIDDNTTLAFYIRSAESANGAEGATGTTANAATKARFNEAAATSASHPGNPYYIKKTSAESHTHSGTVTINNSSDLLHVHNIPSGLTGITLNDPGHNHNITDSGHSHSLNINPLVSTIKTDTIGTHIHPASSFSGRIGKVTDGTSGNSDITTSANSSLNTSQSNELTSSSNTIPHMFINFIIKVK